MAVPPVIAAQLAKMAPEAAREVRSKVRRLGETFADQFGLTAEHEYVGWKLLMILGAELWYNKLKGPMTTAYHIETQLVGLIEQAYSFLGGVGSAFENGVGTLEKDLGTVASDISGGAEWIIGHL